MMPEKRTIEKARKAKRAGKALTTQAGEFVREKIRKIRRGEHGARSPQQAIAKLRPLLLVSAGGRGDNAS
jgi:hypothetical protein